MSSAAVPGWQEAGYFLLRAGIVSKQGPGCVPQWDMSPEDPPACADVQTIRVISYGSTHGFFKTFYKMFWCLAERQWRTNAVTMKGKKTSN